MTSQVVHSDLPLPSGTDHWNWTLLHPDHPQPENIQVSLLEENKLSVSQNMPGSFLEAVLHSNNCLLGNNTTALICEGTGSEAPHSLLTNVTREKGWPLLNIYKSQFFSIGF